MKKRYFKIFDQEGTSLVEAIIYLAIVGILLVAVVNFHLTLTGTTSKISSKINASQGRRVSLSMIDYLARNSDGLFKDVNGTCMTSTALALYFDDDSSLPGTCVENGGGVVITASSTRIQMTCYPNTHPNGRYNACNANPGNVYYLSSPSVTIADNGLLFSTSTATSTFSSFVNITTELILANVSNNQTELLATSTASSTITIRNESPDGLVSWWKMDDAVATAITDSKGPYSGTCVTPAAAAGLVNGSSGSFDFEVTESDYCDIGSAEGLNINGSFTITTWVKPESFVAANIITHKHSWANKTGYTTWLQANKFYCRVCDDAGCTGPNDDFSMTEGNTYHVACTFDRDNGVIKMYVFEEGVGGVGTTTYATIRENMVNYETNMRIGESSDVSGNHFDGWMDELRIYNRKLSDEEIWALQSQGAVAN
jgi:hypothetical protein